MDKVGISLSQITIAATNVEAMVHFYDTVFHAMLTPFKAYGYVLYKGKIAGFDLVIVPNEMLEIEANRNRIQLDFLVTDLASAMGLALNCGGMMMDETGVHEQEGHRVLRLYDPDGNTLVLVEWTG